MIHQNSAENAHSHWEEGLIEEGIGLLSPLVQRGLSYEECQEFMDTLLRFMLFVTDLVNKNANKESKSQEIEQ